jgi:hypothetical protein
VAFLGLLLVALAGLLLLSGWANYSLTDLLKGKLVKRG